MKQASVHAKWVIGRVIGTKMVKTAKVRVTRLVLDPYLLKVKCDFAHLLFYHKTSLLNLVQTLFESIVFLSLTVL